MNMICQEKYTMPYSTLFWSIYTNSVCSLIWNNEILIIRESKKIYMLSRHPNVKNKIALNVICQKIYTMPFSTLFWSIYTNSICSLMQNTEILYLSQLKKIQILSRHHNVKNKIFLNIICQTKYTVPFSTLCWSIYTNSICSLM